MKDDRLRQPVRSDYAESLGRAIYCFTLCEWNVLWCSERIQPGSLSRGKKRMSGKIAKDFLNLVRAMPESDDRRRMEQLAERFSELVKLRNEIVHGKPCTGPNREARLSGRKVLEIEDIDDAADAFSECAIELNREFHGFLRPSDQDVAPSNTTPRQAPVTQRANSFCGSQVDAVTNIAQNSAN